MSETKHTPGPWKVKTVLDEVDQIQRKVVSVPTRPTHQDKHIAAICTWGGSPDPEADANASLIAAAPDLLETLRTVETAIRLTPSLSMEAGWSKLRADVRAAIARAEGGKP